MAGPKLSPTEHNVLFRLICGRAFEVGQLLTSREVYLLNMNPVLTMEPDLRVLGFQY